MTRFFIALIFLSSLSLSAADCPLTFSYSTKNLSLSADTYRTITSDIQSDIADLQAAFTCVSTTAGKLPELTTPTIALQYQEVIAGALVVQKYAANLQSTLKALKESSTTTTTTTASWRQNNKVSSVSETIKTAIADAKNVASNSSDLASGLSGIYEKKMTVKTTDVTAITDNADKKLDANATIPSSITKDDGSLLTKVETADTEAKAKTALIGDYSDQNQLATFQSKLKASGYDYKVTTPITTVALLPANDGTTKTTITTTTAATGRTLNSSTLGDTNYSNLTADQLKSALATTKDPAQLAAIQAALDKQTQQDKLDKMQQTLTDMQKYAPQPYNSTTGNSSPSSSGGGGGAAASASAPPAVDLQKDADKKRYQDMAKHREEASAQAEMRGALKGEKAVRASFLKGLGTGLSLRDIFGGTKSDEPTTTEKKAEKDKSLAFLEEDLKGTGEDKYKKYYKMGKGPDEFAPKDLFKNQFDSMYEAARIKALTEDANTEFAGRYVDLLLLVHSIIDDYYRRGMLVDTTEVIKPVELRK